MDVRKFLFIFVYILSIFLTGCGGQEDAAVHEEDAISDYYTMEVIPLDTETGSGQTPLIADREIYWAVQEEGNVCVSRRMNIDDREIVKDEFSLVRPYNLIGFTADSEGSLYYLLSVKWDPAARDPDDSNKAWDLYLMKRSGEGEEVFYREITEGTEISGAVHSMWVDSEGRICFQRRNRENYQLYLYDGEGQYLGEETCEYDREAIDEYNRQAGSLEKFGIQRKDVGQIAGLEDGRIEVIASNWDTGVYELVLLTPSSVPFRAGRTELVLGLLQGSSLVKDLVVDFNKSHEDIYVAIQEYQPAESPRTAEDAASALMGDILAGNGPDIIGFGLGDELGKLAVQGVMEDLEPYVERSGSIRREDYLPAAWGLGKKGNLLYGIPMRFSLQTLAGKASLPGGQEGWDVPEFMAFAEAHPESMPVDPCSKSRILSLCILFQAGKYLDSEAGTSRFDTPEFRDVMEFADTFAPDESPASAADERKYRDGSVLLMEADLYDAESCLEVYRAFGMEPLAFPGYPSGEEAGGYLISRCGVMYGITSCSAHKQEAWEFVEHAVRRDAENERTVGFPARREELEAYLDRELSLRETEPWLADELREVIFALAERSVTETGWGSGAAEILAEEAVPYFNGRKSLDKTIEVIENRMNLLLGE